MLADADAVYEDVPDVTLAHHGDAAGGQVGLRIIKEQELDLLAFSE